MALGFTKEYDTSIYDVDQFIEVWPEISEIGLEIAEGVAEKMEEGEQINPGSSNVMISYIKGCVFMLGFSDVDKGSEVDLYDQYMSAAVLGSRGTMADMGFQINIIDVVDSEYVNGLIKLFETSDEEDLKRLWSSLAKNKKQTPEVVAQGGKTGVEKAETDPNASASTPLPRSSVERGKEIRPGFNFPSNAAMAQMSVQYSLAKDGSKNLSTNFKVSDFKSKDGSDVVLVNPSLITLLEKIRKHFGKPVRIISGYRTPSYNAGIKGAAKNSQHMYGNAADIKIEGVTPKEIYDWMSGWHKGGLGLYPTFTHIDVRDTVGQNLARWGKGLAPSDIA